MKAAVRERRVAARKQKRSYGRHLTLRLLARRLLAWRAGFWQKLGLLDENLGHLGHPWKQAIKPR
jgi:hypothetical protein